MMTRKSSATTLGGDMLQPNKKYGHQGIHAEELFDALYSDHVVPANRKLLQQTKRKQRASPKLVQKVSYVLGDWLSDKEWLGRQMDEMEHSIATRQAAKSIAPVRAKSAAPGGRRSTPDMKEQSLRRSLSTRRLPKEEQVKIRPASARTLTQRASSERLSAKRSGEEQRVSQARSLAFRTELLKLPAMHSAMRKCGAAATTFSKGATCGTYEHALAREKMDATVLDSFLRQNFPNLRLDAEELGALFTWMDADGDRVIEATEFLREFWKFASVEKMRAEAERKKLAQRKDRRKKAHHADWMQRFAKNPPVKVSVTFEEADLEAAEAALAGAAADTIFEPRHRKIFDGPPVGPENFADLIKRHFNVTLEASQLAAIMCTYDTDNNGLVDGSEFYKAFTKLGRRERQRRQEKKSREATLRRKRADRHSQKMVVSLGGKPKEAKVVWPDLKLPATYYRTDPGSPIRVVGVAKKQQS